MTESFMDDTEFEGKLQKTADIFASSSVKENGESSNNDKSKVVVF